MTTSPDRRWSRRAASVALALIATAVVAMHLARLSSEPVSVCFHDELHYFQYARELASGHAPRYNGVFASKFPPGYSVAIAPAWWLASWLGDGPRSAAWWMRFLNALIAASTVIPAYRLARAWRPRLVRGPAVLAAAVATLLAHQAYAAFLLSETLLVPLVLWSTLAVARLAAMPGAGLAIVAGGLVAACTLTKMAYGVAGPAVLVAIAWSVRPWSRALVAAGAFGLTFGAAVATYLWRDRLFASEAAAKTLFSYGGEYASAGDLPLSVYWHYFQTEASLFALALSPLVLALAAHRLLVDVTETDRRTRAMAAFSLALVGFLLPVVAVWVSRAVHYASEYHERYFVALWPLATLYFVRQVVTPHGGWIRFAAGAALAVVLLGLIPWPLLVNDSSGPGFSVFDVISTGSARRWVDASMAPHAMRWLLAVPLLAVPLLWRGRSRRWRSIVLLLGVAYLLHTSVHALRDTGRVAQDARRHWSDVWRWVDEVVKPNDILVHHTQLGTLAYHHALRRNADYLFLDDDLTPNWESGLRFDAETGVYSLPAGRRGTGRLLLLTASPAGSTRAGEVSRQGPYRLLDLSGGLAPLGRWDATWPELRRTGVTTDMWCGKRAELILPVEYPARYRARLVIEHPAESPIDAPIALRVRGPCGILLFFELARGAKREIPWEGNVWHSIFRIEIVADRTHRSDDGAERSVRITTFDFDRVR